MLGSSLIEWTVVKGSLIQFYQWVIHLHLVGSIYDQINPNGVDGLSLILCLCAETLWICEIYEDGLAGTAICKISNSIMCASCGLFWRIKQGMLNWSMLIDDCWVDPWYIQMKPILKSHFLAHAVTDPISLIFAQLATSRRPLSSL